MKFTFSLVIVYHETEVINDLLIINIELFKYFHKCIKISRVYYTF